MWAWQASGSSLELSSPSAYLNVLTHTSRTCCGNIPPNLKCALPWLSTQLMSPIDYFMPLALLQSTYIYKDLTCVHFSQLNYKLLASQRCLIHLCLTFNNFALENSTLFQHLILYADSEIQRTPWGSPQLTPLICGSNYRKLTPEAPPICFHSIKKFFLLIQHFVLRLIK